MHQQTKASSRSSSSISLTKLTPVAQSRTSSNVKIGQNFQWASNAQTWQQVEQESAASAWQEQAS
jgi:hypothetical protein